MARFAYYDRLSRAEQAVYRRSDARREVPLTSLLALRALVPPVATALGADDKRAVAKSSSALVAAVLDDLGAPPVQVRVLATRPKERDGGELHGLYEAFDDGSSPILRVWMRTAAKRQPVALKTFVRTVMHEVVHHLDYTIFDLAPSFHCEGFFQREAHLSRQLLADIGVIDVAAAAPAPAPTPALAPAVPRERRQRAQLELF